MVKCARILRPVSWRATPTAQHRRAERRPRLAFEVVPARSPTVLGGGLLRLGLDEGVAEFLASLEARIAFGGDRDGLASPWITALALLLFLNDEATKSAKIYAFTATHRSPAA